MFEISVNDFLEPVCGTLHLNYKRVNSLLTTVNQFYYRIKLIIITFNTVHIMIIKVKSLQILVFT